MIRTVLIPTLLVLIIPINAGASDVTFPSVVKPFLQKHCMECHGADSQEGDVVFHELTGIDADNVELWKRVWEQVALKEMPPRDSDVQPAPIERIKITGWITAQIATAMKDKGGFNTHLQPAKGNHLDHDLLFGDLASQDWAKTLQPASSPARIWRIRPQEHLVRLNALINQEPEFNPKKPGLRTRGDLITPNLDGELKVYFGLDRVIGWVGGTAAYAAAVTGFPPVLSTSDHHGLRDYPILYSVNGAEATQIASTAEDILHFMAFGPKAKPYQFADKASQIDKKYKHADLRGLAESLFYSKEPKRPMTPVFDLMHEPEPTESNMKASINFLFESLTCRPPSEAETNQYLSILKEAIADLGHQEGAILGLVPIFLDRDALFRTELAAAGTADKHGRTLLQNQELGLAVNSAFSYLAPDATLKQAIANGQMRTRDDVQREVVRILNDDTIRKPRLLQFFREFFDYDRAGAVCKDTVAMLNAGAAVQPQTHYRTMFAMTASTDRLVELILQEDKNVLAELLTTDRVVYAGGDAAYFGEFVSPDKPKPKPNAHNKAKKSNKRNKRRVTIRPAQPPKGTPIHVRVGKVIVGKNADKRTLTTLPTNERMGILTHPSWLVSHSDAMDNHAILRGRWVRERLLGGAVPDVPITVDAMLPDEPKETLRHRMRVTRDGYCWKCHQKMDPLGLPFEMFNHIGLYRKIEHNKPVDTSGAIIDSGDPQLDGPVENALDMIQKMAKSKRVNQVFVRHVFRFWMGRNETLNDAPILQAAWRAYEDNNGSMKALLTSLLTSDAFLYRKVEPKNQVADR